MSGAQRDEGHRDTVGSRGEEAVIAALVAACPTLPAPAGPGDDCAVLPPVEGRGVRVITTDALIEGTHFLARHPAWALGWKALAVNLSDVAAMGAVPEGFLVSVALPRGHAWAAWTAFCAGLGAYAKMNEAMLVGGDTVRGEAIALTITAWGRSEGAPLTRSGGRPGDVLMVAGHLGRSAVGLTRWLAGSPATWGGEDVGRLEVVQAELARDTCLAAQLAPEPPLWAGPWALAHGATAGMDLSDGLATDLPRLARASQVTLEVDLDHLPEDPALVGVDARTRAAGGEDYAFVCLVDPSAEAAFRARGFAAIGRAFGPREAAPATQGETGPAPSSRVLWRDGGRVVEPVTPDFAHFAVARPRP